MPIQIISSKSWLSLAISNGNVYGFGQNYSNTPTKIDELSNITQIAAGYKKFIALKEDEIIIADTK